jgi:ATP-dependent Lhr-like helicase
VKRAKTSKGVIPAWMGGRMPLSSHLAAVLKRKLDEASRGGSTESELTKIDPLIALQQTRSRVPGGNQLLVESMKSREGHHIFVFPFEGRFVHEGMASLLAYRLSLIKPLSFSVAMNDYGFELLSDQPIPINHHNAAGLFSPEHLLRDIQTSINLTEMARRKFREIGTIAGLVFRGYPNKPHPQKHLQSSTQLLFDVFQDYHPENILLKQAYQEVMDYQLEAQRLRRALEQIVSKEIVITHPQKFTPFAFPILVDRLREKISYEKLEDRIKKMTLQLEKV